MLAIREKLPPQTDEELRICPFYHAPDRALAYHRCITTPESTRVSSRYVAVYCTTQQHSGCGLFVEAQKGGRRGKLPYIRGRVDADAASVPLSVPVNQATTEHAPAELVAASGLRAQAQFDEQVPTQQTAEGQPGVDQQPVRALGQGEDAVTYRKTLGTNLPATAVPAEEKSDAAGTPPSETVVARLSRLLGEKIAWKARDDERGEPSEDSGQMQGGLGGSGAVTGSRHGLVPKASSPRSIGFEGTRTAIGRSATLPATPTTRVTKPPKRGPTITPAPSSPDGREGIGCTRFAWEASHGRPELEVSGLYYYEGGRYMVSFLEERLRHVTRNWSGDGVPLREARAYALEQMPDDAKRARLASLSGGRLLEVYKSRVIIDSGLFLGITDRVHGGESDLISVVYRVPSGRVEWVVVEVGGPALER